MRAADLLLEPVKKYRQSINPPYKRKDLISILGTLFILLAIPLTVFVAVKVRPWGPRAAGTVAAPTTIGSVIEPGSMVSGASYIVFVEGTNYYAKDGKTGEIKFSGSADASPVIQAAMDALPASGGKVVLSEGTFTLATRINFPADNVALEGMGREATKLVAVNSSTIDSVMVRIAGRSNCSVRRLSIDGNKANQTILLVGLQLYGANNCDVEDVSITNTTYAGLYVEGTTSTLPNHVRRVLITGAGNLAVIPGGSPGFLIEVDTVGSVIEDVTVFGSSGHGMIVAECDYTKLIRPRAISNAGRGISTTAKYLEVVNPYAASNGQVGMEFHGYDGIGHTRVLGGVTELNGTAAIFSEGSGMILVANPYSEVWGLVARYNAVADGPDENAGIGLDNSDFVTMTDVVCEFNGGPGITLYSSSDNRIVGATVRNNGQYASAGGPYGIILGNDGAIPSSRNTFDHVRATDDQTPKTQEWGISIRSGAASSDNRVMDSDLSGNLIGDYDDSSGGTGNEVRGIGALADPGNAGAIPVYASGAIALVTTGAQTRTLAVPTFVGQEITLYMKTDGGNCVVTAAADFVGTANNIATVDDAGDTLKLEAVEVGANLRWLIVVNQGVTLSG